VKHVSFLFASLLLLVGQSVYAQAPDAEPEPEVSDEEPLDEQIEEELDEEAEEADDPGEPGGRGPAQDPLPEDPTPEPGPNIVHEAEVGGSLGQTVSTPDDAVLSDEVVEEAAEEAAAEETRADVAEEIADGETSENEASTADRLAQANPNSGLPWALPITWTQSLSAGTLSRGRDLTYNPTYAWNFTAVPRWNFDNGLSLGLLQSVDIELTQSDFTTGERQLWWGDTRLDATYTLPWKPGGTLIIPSLLISAPTSLISRAAGRYLGLGGRLLLIKPIPILGGLILGGGVSYTGWIAGSYGGSRPDSPFRCNVVNENNSGDSNSADCPIVGGPTNVQHVLSAGLFGTLIPAAGWQINLSITGIWNIAAGTGTDCVNIDSGLVCLDDNSPSHVRTLTSFGFSFGYDITTYMTLSLGYSTLAFHPDSEGEESEGLPIENPFYNENSQLTLSLQFRVDGLVVHRMAKNAEAEAAAEEAANDALRAVAF